jgi:outer membrane protein TolC
VIIGQRTIAAGLVALAFGAGLAPWQAARGDDDLGPAKRVGLRDMLKLAVRQNPTLASETVDIGIADSQITSTYGLDDWVVDGKANWASTRTDKVTGQPFQQLASDHFELGGGLTKPLSTGGRVGLRLDATYNQATNFFTINMGGVSIEQESRSTVWSPSVAITLFQPILKGFGEKYYRQQRYHAQVDRTIQEIERESSASTVVRDVVSGYWELAYAAEELNIRRQSLSLAQEQLRVTKALVDAGKVAKTEQAAAEEVIAEREALVYAAEQAVVDRSIELRQLTGMEIGPGDMLLEAADKLDTEMPVPDTQKALAAALDNNPQIKNIREQGRGAAIDVEVTDSGMLPQLDFSASAGPSGTGDTARDAFTHMGKFNSYSVSAGLVFTMNIGNDGAKGAHAAAQGKLRKIKMTEQDVRAQIATAVVKTIGGIKVAKKQLEAATKAVQLAQINIDAEKARWEQGRSTNFDVLKRQDELAQAELRQVRARADYLKLIAVLEALTGEILGRYGIELMGA